MRRDVGMRPTEVAESEMNALGFLGRRCGRGKGRQIAGLSTNTGGGAAEKGVDERSFDSDAERDLNDLNVKPKIDVFQRMRDRCRRVSELRADEGADVRVAKDAKNNGHSTTKPKSCST